MKVSISKSNIRGSVSVPSSKSYTIRALIAAALAKGESEIINPLGSDDTEACRGILENLGVTVKEKDNRWVVEGGIFQPPAKDLFCNESAATMRFMTAVCAVVPGECRLTVAPPLAKRPIEPLLEPLMQLGVECRKEEDGSVLIRGGTLQGGTAKLPGNISSQYVSAMLFISPFAEHGMDIRLTTPLESWPYVQMTLECLSRFSITVEHDDELKHFTINRQEYQAARYPVEGDWSSASYPLAMGAIAGEVESTNLNPESLQADKKILDFLRNMGASIELRDNSIITGKSKLHAIKADLTDCIDLLPTMGILAAVAEGTSEFTGIERARLKESNRVASVKTGLEKMGVNVIEEQNRLSITGSPLKSAVIDANNDHRIAMSFSLLGLIAGDTVIEGAECVSKTYPEFWDILKGIGGRVRQY
ncbi:MAG: 3-phosphoshikimate 1-carboxyvinyltransferase [Dehalococcoidales bacterium]|nr:3-phosphoshikimate 1-carboxyvinyltransferase [Dehalococcoidales bacterium]